MQKKAFIFDFDGTLAETFPMICHAILTAYKNLGVEPPSTEVVYANFGPSELGLLKRVTPQHAQEIFDEYIRLNKEIIAKEGMRPFNGIREVLEELVKRGMKLALITGKSKESLYLTLDAIGLSEYFSILKWGEESGSVKPKCLREVLEELKISPEQAYYIGDSPQDILDCREVGVEVLSAAWADCADVKKLEKLSPKAILKNVNEVLNYC